jgi:hypothetical protein
MPPEETDGRCWQCGAPADAGCVCTKTLVNHADYADGLGNPVTRTKWWGTYYVEVSIPRCEACQLRNWLSGFLLVCGFLMGGFVGGTQFPSRGMTTIIGAALGCVPGVLVGMYYLRIRGLRSLDDYPPLKRLRECGWVDPN